MIDAELILLTEYIFFIINIVFFIINRKEDTYKKANVRMIVISIFVFLIGELSRYMFNFALPELDIQRIMSRRRARVSFLMIQVLIVIYNTIRKIKNSENS